MLPKPPLPGDLTLEEEIEAFEGLKPRLQDLWETVTMRQEEPHTSVVVPSLTLDQAELRKLAACSDAPPTSAPSTSACAMSTAAFSGLTLPP